MEAIAGKRVLIVKDNALIGEVAAETISEAGGWPLGPVLTEREALDMISYNPGIPDAAILDVHLDGSSFVVAEKLHALGVPFIFATGHRGGIPDHLSSARICHKPYSAHDLLTALTSAITADGS
jgi:CheY-like chemotaxis protein